jgi:hypothetical protein
MFEYPKAAPVHFDQLYKGDRIQITLQYELLAKPLAVADGLFHIKVDIKASSSRRIAAIQLRIIAHDNQVVDVQPRSLKIGPEHKWEVEKIKVHEKKRQFMVCAGIQKIAKLAVKGDNCNTVTHTTTESGTRSSIATITGQPMRTFTDNDTADWSLKEAKTSYGGDGIKGYEGDCLTFSLRQMPHRFSYDCLTTFVDSEGGERTHHKNSFGFWEKFKPKIFH